MNGSVAVMSPDLCGCVGWCCDLGLVLLEDEGAKLAVTLCSSWVSAWLVLFHVILTWCVPVQAGCVQHTLKNRATTRLINPVDPGRNPK